MASWITKMVSVTIGGKRSGSYNISTGVIKHPPYGSGKKSPKVKSKTERTK
jgi:hypothetical protein